MNCCKVNLKINMQMKDVASFVKECATYRIFCNTSMNCECVDVYILVGITVQK